MNAKVYIEIGIKSKERQYLERFKPTITRSNQFRYVTDLDNYLSVTNNYATEVYNFIQEQYARGVLEMGIHIGITIQNVTAPVSGKGVVPREKARRDSAMNDVELSSIQVLKDHIDKVIGELREKAEY